MFGSSVEYSSGLDRIFRKLDLRGGGTTMDSHLGAPTKETIYNEGN